jgi:hypothetical protein
MVNTRIQKALPTVASIAVGVIPVLTLIWCFGVPRRLIMGWGALSYVAGVAVFKMPLYHLVVVRVLHGRVSNVWLGVSQGLVSAISELGAALLFFIFVVPHLGLAQLIGFGTAAGALEAIVLPFIGNPLQGTPLEKHSSAVFERASSGLLLPWMSVLERVLALIPHIAARGLVYVSFVSGNILPAVLAVVTFASIDGGAYFAHLEQWEFDRVSVLRRVYLSLATIGVFQTALFAIFYHALI